MILVIFSCFKILSERSILPSQNFDKLAISSISNNIMKIFGLIVDIRTFEIVLKIMFLDGISKQTSMTFGLELAVEMQKATLHQLLDTEG